MAAGKAVGELIGGGELDADHATAELYAAARVTGLPDDEIADILGRMIAEGMANPRQAPVR